jgi:hypothetical protein
MMVRVCACSVLHSLSAAWELLRMVGSDREVDDGEVGGSDRISTGGGDDRGGSVAGVHGEVELKLR